MAAKRTYMCMTERRLTLLQRENSSNLPSASLLWCACLLSMQVLRIPIVASRLCMHGVRACAIVALYCGSWFISQPQTFGDSIGYWTAAASVGRHL